MYKDTSFIAMDNEPMMLRTEGLFGDGSDSRLSICTFKVYEGKQ